MIIELNRKDLTAFFIVIAGLDLLFILMTSPLMDLPVVEGQPVRFYSIFDFIRFQLDLKNEGNIATWYSSCLSFVAGLMALLNSRAGLPSSRWKYAQRAGWVLVGIVCILLSADETATIHERLAPIVNSLSRVSGGAQVRVGAGDWVPLLLPFILATAAGMGLFFWLVHSQNKKFALLGFAGIICWGSAIWAEAIEAGILRIEMSRAVEGMIEEGLEIIGTSLLLFAFVEFYGARQFESSAEPVRKTKTAARTSRD